MVQEANLIKKIDAVYPPLAVQARISGQVRFTVYHRKGRHLAEYSACQRTSAAGRGGAGRGESVCLQADVAEWESGGGYYAGGCQFFAGELKKGC